MDRLNPNGKHRAKFAASHEKTRRGMPFSLVIARYFVYVLIGSLFVAGAVVSLLIAAVNSGVLYPSNYASIDHEAMVGKIEARGTVEDDDVPSCYRWGVFDKTGKLVEGDFDARSEELAEAFLRDGSVDSVAYSSPLGSPVYATSASLENGDVCVLIYDFNPDFVSKALRDAFPDPQGAVLLLGAVLFAAMLALIAMRASHVLQRKLSPLVDAARRIGSRDLDFKIGTRKRTRDQRSPRRSRRDAPIAQRIARGAVGLRASAARGVFLPGARLENAVDHRPRQCRPASRKRA